jgi:AcrR family transcriptional regulator
MGRTTLYQYFKDKDEIFDYVAEQLSKNLETDCMNILENKKLSAADKLKMIISLLTLQYQLEKNKMLMMIEMWLLSKRENDTLKKKFEKRINVLRKMFEQLLEEGIKAKEFKKINPKAMAFTISTLVETFVLQAAFANNISYQEHLNNIYALLNGLKA